LSDPVSYTPRGGQTGDRQPHKEQAEAVERRALHIHQCRARGHVLIALPALRDEGNDGFDKLSGVAVELDRRLLTAFRPLMTA
jgi:hypothetical protein